ncbi:Rv1733c family protein [Lentzea flava]|uniref:Transmembrane protein n=1 Tax=Lentzea flava TaxID=103732 RepID=A0ABQ2USY6_9PSEU|nr:hypothetical protein [Lentzea flava]MCP2197297.1 hypothetical protein [Lentzea flava]GGU50124.1 hypothetical protein GCM10010178_48560 [Lentzea flava]
MGSKLLSRVVRQAFPGRNELATAGDRLEGAVLAAALAVALLAVPVAGAVGSELHARQQTQVSADQQTRQRAEAVLLENAPPVVRVDDRGTVLETAPVRATWHGPDGQERQGEVQAHYGAIAGTTVPIWIDRHGGLTPPPLSAEGAVITAIGVALLVWSAVTAAFALLYLVIRFVHTRLRARRWDLEWRQVSRDWTTR